MKISITIALASTLCFSSQLVAKKEIIGNIQTHDGPVTIAIENDYEPKKASLKPRNKQAEQIYVKIMEPGHLCGKEKQALDARHAFVEKAFQDIFKENHSSSPRVSIVASGGGYRAMISTLGLLLGLNDIQALDTVSYMIGLSGSTWTMAAWLVQELNNGCSSLEDFKDFLKDRVSSHLLSHIMSISGFIEILEKKFVNGQPISVVDIYGVLLGNMLFGNISNAGKDIHMTDLQTIAQTGLYPFPIFTSIIPLKNRQYAWQEHTPFEASVNNLFIEHKAFGSHFNNGKSEDILPEQTLAFLLGIFGSAFALSPEEIIDIGIEGFLNSCFNVLQRFGMGDFLAHAIESLEEFIAQEDNGDLDKHYLAAEICNYMLNMDECEPRMKDKDIINAIDAGISINIPFPPAPKRATEIYIICDATGDVETASAMDRVIQFAHDNNIKIPKIDIVALKQEIDDIDPETDNGQHALVKIFTDPRGKNVPVIIYIASRLNFSTLKFSYSNNEFDQLVNHVRSALNHYKDDIINAIALKAAPTIYNPNITTESFIPEETRDHDDESWIEWLLSYF